jgi:hypothetical protein
LGLRDLEYKERHHIVPRCLGGEDGELNLVYLSLREHFIAHWMLYNSYPNNYRVMSALYQMCNKNPKVEFKKRHMKFERGISSQIYEKKKREFYVVLSEALTGWVTVSNRITGEKVRIKTGDFDRRIFRYTTEGHIQGETLSKKGRVVCVDKETNKWVSVRCEEYNKNKHLYFRPESFFTFVDLETNTEVTMKKSEIRSKNKECGYKRFRQKLDSHIACLDSNGTIVPVPLCDYDPSKHTHVNKNRFNVIDTTTGIRSQVSYNEYNSEIHKTSTKGKVVSRDNNGATCLVGKEEYLTGNFVGVTRGLTTVKSIETGEYEQISTSTFLQNKHMYKGPATGMSNVINVLTGIRQQMPTKDVDKDVYVNLGKNNQYFRAKNKLTKLVKNISIFEWNKTIFDSDWEVLDHDLFEKRKELLNVEN